MNTDTAPKYWEKTRLNNMVRHTNGRYYARLFLNRKEIWKSLKTTSISIAEARLAVLLKEHRDRKGKAGNPLDRKMNFAEAAALHLDRIGKDVSLKQRTRDYWRETLASLLKSWPALASTPVRRVASAACVEWAARIAKEFSESHYNGMVSLLRHILALAVEEGVITSNPATAAKRKQPRAKKLELPTLAQFVAFIAEVKNGGGRHSKNCADFVQGLAFTGCRLGEASQIAWKDLDFANGEIVVKGDPEDATKNGEIRRVPMISQARELFQGMRASRTDEPEFAMVFLVNESQRSITRAAKKVGMTRITHHDLRHFFATVCIESGVDIPTVSRWLGHQDGGALAMRTYGHLRREHSAAQALKVSFTPVANDSAPQAPVSVS